VSLALSLYRVATGLLEPLAPGLLRSRAARGKEDAARLGERLGRTSMSRPDGPMVWLHGVSVGESLSLLPLAEALRTRRPDLNLLVTSGTRTSADLLADRLPAGMIHQYVPVDGPAAVARFFDHWRPDLGILVESELWPNLIRMAHRRGVKLVLASARMTEASARGWSRAPGAARALLAAFDAILPQDGETAARLAGLGGRVGPDLNLKLVGGPLPHDEAELARLRAKVGDRKVILAASTHAGEEEIIAEAARNLPALLVVTPRHPDRGAAIAASLKAAGFAVARRGADEPLTPEVAIYLADTLGEMGLFYRLADVAVMGGSLVPGIGGHNPLEPARLGVPVVTGPQVFNAAAIYEAMFDRVAALTAADAGELRRHLKGLIAYPDIRARVGEAGLDFAQAQGAALDAALDHLAPLLPA
jgi:3-deoxy-D-manno-octulosonic-acid transferase